MMLGINRNRNADSHPRYLAHFKFQKAPFSARLDPEFFYADPQRSQYLDMLQHLTQYSDELLLVTGEEGVGKTALLEQYLDRAEEHWRICHLEGGDNVDAGELFIHLARCFDLEVSKLHPEQLLNTLHEHLNSLQQKILPVLVIDDADLLSEDALEIVMHLASMAGEDGQLLRTLLFSDADILKTLEKERFQSLVEPHRLELGRLDDGQIAEYLRHRGQVAGYTADSPFNAKQQRRICKLSHGIPLAINQLANELLQEQMERERPGRMMAGGYRTFFKVGAAGLALTVTALTLYERLDSLKQGNDLKGQPAHRTARVVSSEPALPIVRDASRSNAKQMEVVIRDGQTIQINRSAPALQEYRASSEEETLQPMLKEIPLESERELLSIAASAGKVVDEQTSSGEKPDTREVVEGGVPDSLVKPVIESISPEQVVGSDSSQTVLLHGQGFVDGLQVAVSSGGRARIVESGQVKVIDSTTITIDLITGVASGSWAIQVNNPSGKRSNSYRFNVIEPGAEPGLPDTQTESAVLEQTAQSELPPVVEQPPVVEVQAPPSIKERPLVAPSEVQQVAEVEEAVKSEARDQRGIEGNQWLRQQPAGNFTLQLISGSKQAGIEQFARDNDLPMPLAMLSTSRDGTPRYALLQGSYSSREAAVAAAASQPTGIKPWIRSFTSIHSALAAGSLPPPREGVRDVAWLWSQDPAAYMLQLAAAGSEQVLRNMARGLKLRQELAVVPSSRDGKPWYLLLVGPYSDYATARSAIGHLPPELEAAGPWPRSVGSVHGTMDQ